MNNKGTDQTARMRRLIYTFAVRIWQNRFSLDMAQIQRAFEKYLVTEHRQEYPV